MKSKQNAYLLNSFTKPLRFFIQKYKKAVVKLSFSFDQKQKKIGEEGNAKILACSLVSLVS